MGGAGAGKTALLDGAADAAEGAGTGVLRAAGVESEADLTYSGLHQVLLPLSGQFERLAAAHRDALNVALGLRGGAAAGSAAGVHRDPHSATPGGRGQTNAGDRR